MEYLENNKSEIVNLFVENKSIDEVEFMLELFGSDRKMIETAIVKAAETGFGEVTALVLKYRRKKEDIRKERMLNKDERGMENSYEAAKIG